MTGFIIFAIVLTLAYVLYFAAMITTDLAAMKKAAETEEENIDIGTGSEEVDEFATQNVVEDPSTGGFNFVTPQQKEAEASEEIVEAEEDENDDDPSASLRNQDEDENVGASSNPEDQEQESEEEPEENFELPETEDVETEDAISIEDIEADNE